MKHSLEEALSRTTETTNVDFKSSFDPGATRDWLELIKDIVSFANSGGGHILVGLDDDGVPSGNSVDALLATLYAQIATLPLVAWTFRDLPLLGLFSNIVAAPLAAIAFPIGVLGTLLLGVAPVIGTALLIPAAFACQGLLEVATIYGKEWASIPVQQLGISVLLIGLAFSVVVVLVAGGEGKLLIRSLRKT